MSDWVLPNHTNFSSETINALKQCFKKHLAKWKTQEKLCFIELFVESIIWSEGGNITLFLFYLFKFYIEITKKSFFLFSHIIFFESNIFTIKNKKFLNQTVNQLVNYLIGIQIVWFIKTRSMFLKTSNE